MTPVHENLNEQDSQLIAPYAWSMSGWPSERQSSDKNALEVWGYAERFSYAPGEVLKLHVSCSQPTYSIAITRDGLKPEIVYCKNGIAGRRYEAPDDSYAQGCGWPVGLEIPISGAWHPGFYLIALSVDGEEDRFQSEAFFAVRKSPESRSGVAPASHDQHVGRLQRLGRRKPLSGHRRQSALRHRFACLVDPTPNWPRLPPQAARGAARIPHVLPANVLATSLSGL